jgi:hypothetical protein
LLEGGRILGALALAAVAAVSLAAGTVFTVLAVDRGGVGYFVASVAFFGLGVAMVVSVFVVEAGRRR